MFVVKFLKIIAIVYCIWSKTRPKPHLETHHNHINTLCRHNAGQRGLICQILCLFLYYSFLTSRDFKSSRYDLVTFKTIMIMEGASFGRRWSIRGSFRFNSCRCIPNTHYKDAISSQRRLMGNHLSKCFFAQCHAWMPGWMTFMQTELIHRHIYFTNVFMTNRVGEDVFTQ